MAMRFLRGDPQKPRGHVIFVARSTQNPRAIFCTYGVVSPTPLSLGSLEKFLPPFLASQLPLDEMRDASSINVMSIPPMLEEGSSFDYYEMLAEHRDDDLCDIGTIDPRDDMARMQLAQESCQEYGQLYLNYSLTFEKAPALSAAPDTYESEASQPLDDLDAEEVLLQAMTDRERLTELGKLVGMARYALEGRDTALLEETKLKMQRTAGRLPDKYRSSDLMNAAVDPSERGAKLAQLYLERSFKLLDEEYADIPRIEQAIRDA